MQTKIDIKERKNYAIIEITSTNGDVYRITTGDGEDFIHIQTINGGLIIQPTVSNEVKISTTAKY